MAPLSLVLKSSYCEVVTALALSRHVQTNCKRIVVTLPGRFAASLSILAVGWYLFEAGSLWVGCYAVSRLPGERAAASMALVILPIGGLTILGAPTFVGEYYFIAPLWIVPQGTTSRQSPTTVRR